MINNYGGMFIPKDSGTDYEKEYAKTQQGGENMIKKTGKDYEGETYDIACDRCSTGAETIYAVDWGDMLSQLRDMGWKLTSKHKKWEHVCPDCEV